MPSRHRVFLWIVSLTIVCSSVALWGFKDFVPPKASNANTYASKDTHPNEHVTGAVDVYSTPRTAKIFTPRFGEEGILPVLRVITNAGAQPISVNNMRGERGTARRNK